ncbi:MAG TPA: hypothetical protein VGP68_24785 [Gemmataceae bacterium]|jgi:hypothetical protein|nr:hypothetical protein [Gemmataceae bacterium]
MLTTVALLAALTSAIGLADDGLTLSHVRQTSYLLGPVRTDDKLLPGDSYNLAFDIDGLKVAPDGKVQYSMGLKVTNSAGKTEFGSEPTPKEEYIALGGSTVPGCANVEIGLNQAPGKYTVKVTVLDKAGKAQEITKTFDVGQKKFGLVRLSTTSDGNSVPTAPLGVPGQTLYAHLFAVGFDPDARTQQPNISIEMKVVDENGKATLEKPVTEVIKAVKAGSVAIPMTFAIHLNRPGKYTAEFTAVDQVSKTTSKLSLPITVLDGSR